MRHNIYHLLLAATGLFISGAAASAQQPQQAASVLDVKTSITDNNIIYPESFEADTRKMLEGWYMKNYMAHDDRYSREKDAPTDDRTIRERLAKLPTVVELPFNQIVRQYIDRYTQRSREQVTVLLGLSHYYLPIFEQALEERGLPLELKYLPVIESGLNPNAVSRHGATGLWQFMIATAKGLDMEVNSLVDERRDPYLSSKRAAQYLSDLYATYGDWSLAIAAYNCGPGAVNKAIRRAGGDPRKHDFWSIYEYLTPETRGYVPMFIAANYVMNYYPEHNISPVVPSKPLVTDTLMISDRVHFNQISAVLDIPVDELRVLNPQFRADLIPGSAEHAYTLVLPSQQIHAYLMSEEAIKNFEAEKYLRRETVEPGDAPLVAAVPTQETKEDSASEEQKLPVAQASVSKGMRTVTHKVAPGESLASIAEKYDVTPEQIKNWNSLRRNAVRVGQLLRITTASGNGTEENLADLAPSRGEQTWQKAEPVAAAPAPAKKQAAKPKAPVTTSHQVKSGESLSSISKKYGVTIAELKKANGMTSDNLRAGATIKVPSKKAAATKGSSKKSKRRRR